MTFDRLQVVEGYFFEAFLAGGQRLSRQCSKKLGLAVQIGRFFVFVILVYTYLVLVAFRSLNEAVLPKLSLPHESHVNISFPALCHSTNSPPLNLHLQNPINFAQQYAIAADIIKA